MRDARADPAAASEPRLPAASEAAGRSRRARLLELRGQALDLRTPKVMGVLNLTPDSFFPASRVDGPDAARRRAVEMLEAGAGLLDLGAASSRPGSAPVPVAEQLARLLPALTAVRRETAAPLSVDTCEPAVARAALDGGADLLNDITGLARSDALARLAAASGAGLALMHMRGTPRTMQQDTDYDDLPGEVCGFLAGAVARAVRAGVPRRRLLVDPGIGFGKSVAGNLLLLGRLEALAELGLPILVGVSRKSFIGKLLGCEVGERLCGSLAAAVAAVMRGADVVRAHDVRETVEAVRIAGAIRAVADQDATASNG